MGSRPALNSTDPRVYADRDKTLAELRDVLSAHNLAGVSSCAARLRKALGGRPAGKTVMVAYGGGKDSSYTLAFVRTMQLLLFEEDGATFTMRVATNRHAGMAYAVMSNVDSSYTALRLYEDPDCELLLIDGDEVSRFAVDKPQHPDVVSRNRLDILMTGHRTFADGRPTFCNACNLSVVNSYGVAAAHGAGVDLIVTGDSPQEQRAYTMWVYRMARKLGLRPDIAPGKGFGGFLATLDDIGRAYATDIHGEAAVQEIEKRRVASDVPRRTEFFSIYDDTAYASGDHWELLTGYLGFAFDEAAFNFTESDCGNPALMAHLRALKCERLYGQTYEQGLEQYLRFVLELMRKKEIPEALIERMARRYRGPGAVDRLRDAMNRYAFDTFGLTEAQLVCMVFAPFAGEAEGLPEYLAGEHPALAPRVAEIRSLLGGAGEPDPGQAGLVADLARLSGLDLERLRVLYRRPRGPMSAGGEAGPLLRVILDGDPHKVVSDTEQSPGAPTVPELMSGR